LKKVLTFFSYLLKLLKEKYMTFCFTFSPLKIRLWICIRIRIRICVRIRICFQNPESRSGPERYGCGSKTLQTRMRAGEQARKAVSYEDADQSPVVGREAGILGYMLSAGNHRYFLTWSRLVVSPS